MADYQIEKPVAIQQDQISQVPGAGIRTILVTVPVGSPPVPTQVQQQVVSIADGDGIVWDPLHVTQSLQEVTAAIRELTSVMLQIAAASGISVVVTPVPDYGTEQTS